MNLKDKIISFIHHNSYDELIFKNDIEPKILIEGFVYSGLLNNLSIGIKKDIFKYF